MSRILFPGGGWYPSMHFRWYPSMPCSRSLGRRGWHPSMACRFLGPHPRGTFEGDLAGESPECTEADPPTATAAGGTHPTGMHSGSLYFVVSPFVFPYLEECATTFFIPSRNKRFLCCLSKGSMTKIYSPYLQSANVMMFSFSSNHTTPVTTSRANFPKNEETMKMKKKFWPLSPITFNSTHLVVIGSNTYSFSKLIFLSLYCCKTLVLCTKAVRKHCIQR